MKYPSAKIIFYKLIGASLVLMAGYFLIPAVSAEADLMCWNGARCTEGEEFVYCGLNPQVNCTQICGERTPSACAIKEETTCANSWYQSCEYDSRCGGAQCCHIYDCGNGTDISCGSGGGQVCGDVDSCQCLPPVSYSWTSGTWSACSYSDSCDETSSRTRSVWCQSSTGAMVDDSYCNSGAKPSVSEVCNTRVTAVNATLSSWSSCNVPAGSCTGTQTRTCSGALCGGSTTCGGAALSQSCPAPAVQGTLSNWSSCTASCGGGTCTQTRTCTGNSCGGNCNGAALTQTYTNNTPCGTCNDGDSCTTDSGTYPNCTNTPVTPVQGTLSNWSSCTASCGGGTCTQTRTCTGNSCGGNCNGASLTRTYVNDTPCASGPDLTASAPSPATATVNVAKTFSSIISNTGGSSTGAGFTNLFQTSPVSNGSSGVVDYPVSGMATLSAGGSATASKSITFTTAGTIYMRACADKSSWASTGVIPESNDNNNCSTWTAVTVSEGNNPPPPPPPPPGSFSLSGSTSCSFAFVPQISLSWGNSAGATSYNVYRNSSLYAPSVSSGWVDPGVTTGITYSYFVRALNGGAAADSNTISQTGPDCASSGVSYDLSVIKSGQGTVDLSSWGGACTPARENCWSYPKDTWVDLTAIPSAGRIFTGWMGCDTSSRNPDGSRGTCSVKMTSDRSVTANFAVDPYYREF